MIRDAAPEQWQFAVVRVTGPYGFNVAPGVADYGHLLPVELLVEPIDRHDPRVSGPLRAALRNRTRLWRIDGVSGDIEAFVGGGEQKAPVGDIHGVHVIHGLLSLAICAIFVLTGYLEIDSGITSSLCGPFDSRNRKIADESTLE